MRSSARWWVLCLMWALATACGEGAREAAAPRTPDAVVVPAPAPSAPPFSSLPWLEIGHGVAFRDSGNPVGEAVFVGYAGYQVTDDEARAWVTALYEAGLADYGVRYVYAVRGPEQVQYDAREIANTRLSDDFIPRLAGTAAPIVVAAHSSGAWVACELFEQLYEGGRDPGGETSGRIVYYDLDGVAGCLSEAAVDTFRGLFFTRAVRDAGQSLQGQSMVNGAARFAGRSTLLSYDATASGCPADAQKCLHVSLVNTRPHDPAGAERAADYTDFEGRPVNRWYLDETREVLWP